MSEIGEEPAADPPPHFSKRKPEPESAADAVAAVETKRQRPETPAEPPSAAVEDGDTFGRRENGEAVVDKGKGAMMERDKGKGKAVVVEEEGGEDDDDDDTDDDDDDSGDESDDGVGSVEVGEDSDFDDDPLAEVDLQNVLPSRTRRRAPLPPGSYLVNDMDGEDEEDEEDEDEEGFD